MKKFCLRLLISGAILSVTGFVVLSVLFVNGYDIDDLSLPVRSYAASEVSVTDYGEYPIEVTDGTAYIMQEAVYSEYGYYDNMINVNADPDDINNIDIDIAMGTFNIVPADAFAIYANNIEADWLKYSVDGDRLSVSFEPKFEFKLFDFNFWDDSAEILLFIPQKVYETISIDIDAGNAYILGLTANNLEFDMSAGEANVSDVAAYYSSDIKMSAGYSQFTRCTLLNSSSIKVSAGDMEFYDSSVTGISDIKVSAGELNMFLLDDLSHYNITAERSAGELYINNEETSREYRASASSEPIGTMNVKISAGSCYINFKED